MNLKKRDFVERWAVRICHIRRASSYRDAAVVILYSHIRACEKSDFGLEYIDTNFRVKMDSIANDFQTRSVYEMKQSKVRTPY